MRIYADIDPKFCQKCELISWCIAVVFCEHCQKIKFCENNC
jgi:hypothetical protein